MIVIIQISLLPVFVSSNTSFSLIVIPVLVNDGIVIPVLINNGMVITVLENSSFCVKKSIENNVKAGFILNQINLVGLAYFT